MRAKWYLVMNVFDFHARTRVIFGAGSIDRLGEIAGELGFKRVLVVADSGMVGCGYVDRVSGYLTRAGIEDFAFHDFGENPDSVMVERGRAMAEAQGIDSIIGLGGGSSMDCAKGINFVLTNGGSIRDYWGWARASKPMLPMIGIPTTSGTGSEAQSYALISDAGSHLKMACGDPKAAFKVAILDPELTLTQPESLTATTGYDAISHAVESYVTRKRNPFSDMFAREAWRLLHSNYERVLSEPSNVEARASMMLGAFFAGMAIENSMLGATHACANPLTKNYGTPHGVAISTLLSHVVRWNSAVVDERYTDLAKIAGIRSGPGSAGCDLADYLMELAGFAHLPTSLSAINVPATDLTLLAEEASMQWTGGFNPREWNIEGAMEVYENAL